MMREEEDDGQMLLCLLERKELSILIERINGNFFLTRSEFELGLGTVVRVEKERESNGVNGRGKENWFSTHLTCPLFSFPFPPPSFPFLCGLRCFYDSPKGWG